MQLDEYCVVFPQCHILEIFYIQYVVHGLNILV